MGTYQYQPIENPRSIRILQLQPSVYHDSTPRCTLKEILLDSSPGYEAVSYTWGSPARTEPIECEGEMLLVTKNCLELLRRFRPESGVARALWIDAICINQASEDERTQQVQLMGDIYSKAEQVLIWLGEADHKSSLAFSYLAKIAARRIPGREMELFKTVADDLSRMEFRGRRELVRAIISIINRPWFSRMWTLQELVLGTKVTVSCGQDSISWDSLVFGTYSIQEALLDGAGGGFEDEESRQSWHDILAELAATHGEEAIKISALTALGPLDATRRAVAKMKGLELPGVPNPIKEALVSAPVAQTMSFGALLFLLHSKQTTDPKDKIFSLYGIAQALKMKMSKPDYSHSLAKIYTDAARAAILHDESLDLLIFAKPYGGSLPGAPSWVPDWSLTQPREGINLHVAPYSQSARDSLPKLAFSADGQRLTLAGIYLDEIVTRERPTTVYQWTDFEQDPTKIFEVFPAIRGWYAQMSTRPLVQMVTGESTKDAFYRALMSTSVIKTFEKQDDHEWFQSHFEEWFALIADDTLTTAEEFLIEVGRFSTIPPEASSERTQFLMMIAGEAEWKAFFVTEKGYIGQSIFEAEVGDLVVILAGMRAPCVIRRVKRPDLTEASYLFVGPAYYVHGAMYGEAWDERSGHLEDFTLV